MHFSKIDEQFPLVLMNDLEEFGTYGAATINGCARSDWTGGMSGEEARRTIRTGHLPSVQESEQYMNAFESLDFKARKWETINDVAGGAVNVGAYLTGSPLSMRRRQAKPSSYAPLTIFCDLVSSAGIEATYL